MCDAQERDEVDIRDIDAFVEDVDAVIQKALSFGAKLLSPAQDYDYGYRQGDFRDPFGHKWVIQKII